MDWLHTSQGELIGIQLDVDLLCLDGDNCPTLSQEAQEARRIAVEKNLSADYMTRVKHRAQVSAEPPRQYVPLSIEKTFTDDWVQIWFGQQRNFDPRLSHHQDIINCNYATPDDEWAVGIPVDPDDPIIQRLVWVNAQWAGNEIHVLRETDIK